MGRWRGVKKEVNESVGRCKEVGVNDVAYMNPPNADRCADDGSSKRPGMIKSTGVETILPVSLDCSCCCSFAEWWLPSRLLLLLLLRLLAAFSPLSARFFFLSDFFLHSTIFITAHC